jgi:hypothetical protein
MSRMTTRRAAIALTAMRSRRASVLEFPVLGCDPPRFVGGQPLRRRRRTVEVLELRAQEEPLDLFGAPGLESCERPVVELHEIVECRLDLVEKSLLLRPGELPPGLSEVDPEAPD